MRMNVTGLRSFGCEEITMDGRRIYGRLVDETVKTWERDQPEVLWVLGTHPKASLPISEVS